jgi:3-oxoacyl-(acyl-carrier-protein) synthase
MSEVYKKLPSRVAGFVPRGDDPEQFNEDKVVSKHEKRSLSPITIFALTASELALNDSGYTKDILDMLPESAKDRMVFLIHFCESACCCLSVCFHGLFLFHFLSR